MQIQKMTKSNLNLICLKSSNMHTNTFHASNPTILPYNIKILAFPDFYEGGFGILPYSAPYLYISSYIYTYIYIPVHIYIPKRPCVGPSLLSAEGYIIASSWPQLIGTQSLGRVRRRLGHLCRRGPRRASTTTWPIYKNIAKSRTPKKSTTN